ncbi:MAG: stalk domain-containing protein, partial [bacterium]
MYSFLIVLLIIFIIILLVFLGLIVNKLSKLEKNNTKEISNNQLDIKNLSIQEINEYKDLKQKIDELLNQEKNLKSIIENLNGEIFWYQDERKVKIILDENIVELWIDKPQARVNDEIKWIDDN